MYNINGDKSVVACRNNLETSYLWIIETAKTTDVYKFSELCAQNIALLAFSHGTKFISADKVLETLVNCVIKLSLHSVLLFCSFESDL